ncbi:uncharacterized protein ACBT57_008349 [Dama dama]|uniref:uncharacterized protein LOC133052615 n=1 Tax=Dama dama TaxID=30532 RepID=UPI002A3600DF|nr:uncharacterized protein LOC133052615 [Dama dama]
MSIGVGLVVDSGNPAPAEEKLLKVQRVAAWAGSSGGGLKQRGQCRAALGGVWPGQAGLRWGGAAPGRAGREGRDREAAGRAQPGVAGRRTGLNLAEAAARAIAKRLAAHPAPEPVSRPLAAWRRRERPVEASAGMRRRRYSRRQGTRTAVGSVKMPPPCESRALAAVEGALRHSPSARESGLEQLPVPSRPRLRDLLALLRSGLTREEVRRRCGPECRFSLVDSR